MAFTIWRLVKVATRVTVTLRARITERVISAMANATVDQALPESAAISAYRCIGASLLADARRACATWSARLRRSVT